MSRWGMLVRFLALWLALMSVPGAEELIEDVVHVLADGHTAHDPAHAGEQPGHCCSGLFHSCPCHVNAVATVTGAVARLAPQDCARAARSDVGRDGYRPGFHALPFRPPVG